MTTEVLALSEAAIKRAAALLRDGQVVAFPTETVYGLGGDALSAAAVSAIFRAKMRPADNPLIAHIAGHAMLPMVTNQIDARAAALMDAFWPGPLTLVLKRGGQVPDNVSAGLPTVAVRMPAHEGALALIKALGRPIAAPSANRSGRPSPTAAAHVLEDMAGRIPLILDGGPCSVGVESTVLDVSGDVPILLRPGGVTLEELGAILPDLVVDGGVLSPLDSDASPRSPGMKHRHYAPKAKVTLVRGGERAVIAAIVNRYDAAKLSGNQVEIFCHGDHLAAYGERAAFSLGGDGAAIAAGLFAALRDGDRRGATLILCEGMDTAGIGLALMNRLLRAADFDVVEA